jgi:hypothetical protein
MGAFLMPAAADGAGRPCAGLLVGCKADLRGEGKSAVEMAEAEALAGADGVGCIECWTKGGFGVGRAVHDVLCDAVEHL